MRHATLLLLIFFVVSFAAAGCGRPNQANIDLRKKLQTLEDEVATLKASNEQLRAQLRQYESSATTVETLPQDRLDQLWTVAGVRLGRLTGIDGGAEGRPLKVYVQPFDEDTATIKAAGDVEVAAFNLDGEGGEIKLGEWTFPAADAKNLWSSGGLINEYVLTCDWPDAAPQPGTELLVRVRFTDALTGRSFDTKQDVTAQ